MIDEKRHQAAAALRALNNAFVAYDGDPEVLDHITIFAREAEERLRSGTRRDRAELLAEHVGRIFSGRPDEGPPQGSGNPLTDRAVGGSTNPIAADFEYELAGSEVIVRTMLGAAYEGAPGRAHGGMVSALFDDFAAYILPLAGTAAYTGELTVRYHRPVPIETLLEFRCRIEGLEGRKLHVTADCRADEELVASADVIYVTVDPQKFGTTPG